MIDKTDLRILQLMIEKTRRIIEISQSHSREEIQKEYTLSDTIQFEFEKLYEDSTRLSIEFRINHTWLHIDDLRSIRNRVAHNYESVSIDILIDTANNDIPKLKELLEDVISEKN